MGCTTEFNKWEGITYDAANKKLYTAISSVEGAMENSHPSNDKGTENRITIARQRLIETIKGFNNLVTVPPTSWTNSIFYQHPKMAQWDVAADEKEKIEKPPEVKF